MITIYKYPFQVSDRVKVSIPGNIFTLNPRTQNPGKGELCLWAIVDTESEEVTELEMRIVGTGHSFDDYDEEKHSYVDTIIDGQFVWHIFEVIS